MCDTQENKEIGRFDYDIICVSVLITTFNLNRHNYHHDCVGLEKFKYDSNPKKHN